MRYLLLFTVLLTCAACKSESDNCFKKQLPIERARYTCYDLWQECEAAFRKRSANACASLKKNNRISACRQKLNT